MLLLFLERNTIIAIAITTHQKSHEDIPISSGKYQTNAATVPNKILLSADQSICEIIILILTPLIAGELGTT